MSAFASVDRRPRSGRDRADPGQASRSCRPVLPLQPRPLAPARRHGRPGQRPRSRRRPMQRITIDPITRLEGHGKIEIFLDEEGEVANTYFQIPELRGFERFCVGPAGRGDAAPDQPHLRRLPRGPPHGRRQGRRRGLPRRSAAARQAPARAPLQRLLLHRSHDPLLRARRARLHHGSGRAGRRAQHPRRASTRSASRSAARSSRPASTVTHIIEIDRRVARSIPATSIPGGLTKGITEEQRVEIEAMGRWAIDFAGPQPALFDDIVMGNPAYRDLILGDTYTHRDLLHRPGRRGEARSTSTTGR